MTYPFLSLRAVQKWEPLAKRLGVSEVARSSRGFLRAYERAGTPSRLPEEWQQKRDGFIARHMAQMQSERWFENDGSPTRRHLALIMWAYSPEQDMTPNASYLTRLIKHYGVTHTPALGGFILPDGSFLDFSEGSGSRAQDHRNLVWVLPRGWEGPHDSRWDGLVRVCKHVGMYRWMPEDWSIDAWTPPTRQQAHTLTELARRAPLIVDAEAGRRKLHEEFERVQALYVAEVLQAFFDGDYP